MPISATGREPPPPFAGWLEEHPDGGFLILHDDGTHSPVLKSYEATEAYLLAVADEGRTETIEDVVRIRHAFDVESGPFDLEQLRKLYPPSD